MQNLNERKANYTFNLFIYSARVGDYAHLKCA